jgi:hypothetical protein
MNNSCHALSPTKIEWLEDGSIKMTIEDSWSNNEEQTLTFESPMLTLQSILKNMKIPEERKTDMRWLRRNLGINNGSNHQYEDAMRLIKQIIRGDNSID